MRVLHRNSNVCVCLCAISSALGFYFGRASPALSAACFHFMSKGSKRLFRVILKRFPCYQHDNLHLTISFAVHFFLISFVPLSFSFLISTPQHLLKRALDHIKYTFHVQSRRHFFWVLNSMFIDIIHSSRIA